MKINVKGPFKENIYTLIRQMGYHFLEESPDKEMNCVRSLSRNDYPRFHMYLNYKPEEISLNLHLDQRKPIYKGTTAHSGDYEGSQVEAEAKRIADILKQ